MTDFYADLDSAVATTTAMIGALGGKGVLITLASIGAALVIYFLYVGWRKGRKAMQGRA